MVSKAHKMFLLLLFLTAIFFNTSILASVLACKRLTLIYDEEWLKAHPSAAVYENRASMWNNSCFGTNETYRFNNNYIITVNPDKSRVRIGPGGTNISQIDKKLEKDHTVVFCKGERYCLGFEGKTLADLHAQSLRNTNS